MSDDGGPKVERLAELLTEETQRPLTTAEKAEVDRLTRQLSNWSSDEFEFAAAALTLYYQDKDQALPAALRAKLAQKGHEFSKDTKEPKLILAASNGESVRYNIPRPSQKKRIRWSWLVAGLAGTIAIAGWWPKNSNPETLSLDNSDLKERLWVTPDLKPAGELRWSDRAQRGQARLRLPPNDTQRAQYQVWIFDRARDERYPVDGGVFNSVDDQVDIDILPKLPITQAVQMVITREAPGGVVVSQRTEVVASVDLR